MTTPGNEHQQETPAGSPAGSVIGPDGTWPMPPGEGPCRTWPLDPHCSCFPTDWDTWDSHQRHAVEVATEILWRKTAGKYGLCLEMVRPCGGPGETAPRGGLAWPDPNGTAPTPASWTRYGSPLSSCGCGGSCGCGAASEIRLPGPVYWSPADGYLLTVWIDGTPLDEPDYRLYGNRLVRTGGTWPTDQDLTAPIQAAGAFGIEYWRGIPVPPGGRRAVAILACELWKACTGDSSCRLPRGIQSISREGIDYTLVDQQADMLANLPDVNGWVQAVNPRGMAERSTVWSPDFPRVRSEWTSGRSGNIPNPRGRWWG